MVERENALTIGAGAIGGIGVPYLIHRYYDIDPETGTLKQLIPRLGAYGSPSALAGIGTGAAALALGIFGDRIGMYDERIKRAAFAYGITSVATGLVLAHRSSMPAAASVARARVVATSAPAATAAPAAAQRITQDYGGRKVRTY